MDPSKSKQLAVIGGLLLFLAFFIIVWQASQQEEESLDVNDDVFMSEEIERQDAGEDPSSKELVVEDMVVGSGKAATAGNMIAVHYTGTLLDGTKFDSSHDRGQPFQFRLGAGQVIEGWEKGVEGMREGGVRRLVIPPHMAYGDRDMGIITPNSTLIFEVELIAVE